MARSERGREPPRRPRPRPTKVERHAPSDPPEGIGGIVRHLLQDRRMRRGVALGRLARAWPEVVGPDLARQTAPRALDGGSLLVAATSAAWGSQVRFLAPEIRRRANDALGIDEVRSVHVMVGGAGRKALRRNAFDAGPGAPEAPGGGVPGW
jgi:predicted nucleic acid-binding Zn ribbon protein